VAGQVPLENLAREPPLAYSPCVIVNCWLLPSSVDAYDVAVCTLSIEWP